MSETNPLIERVDALLKRHQQQPETAGAPEPEDAHPVPGALRTVDGEFRDMRPATPAPGEPTSIGEDADIPVLTEIVDPEAAPAAPVLDQDVLGAQIEAEVLEKLLADLDHALDQRLGREIGDLLEQSMDGLRAELSISLRRMVREAVAASIARTLEERARNL